MDDERPVTQRCPNCHRTFRVLADEAGMHACPHCGYHPNPLRDQDFEEESC